MLSPAPTPLVIFDLDGTLLDTGPDLVDSLNHAIGTVGLAPFEADDVGHLVGQGARVMIRRALSDRGVAESETLINRLQEAFLAHYAAGIPGRSAPYPGVADALDRLAAAGMALAVCTNKHEALARRLLEALAFAPRFAAITGGDSFSVRKPDAGHILETIRVAGADGRPAVMIGDSINDIAAARAAGIASIAVTFGFSDVPVTELGANRVIDHFDALTPALVRGLLAGGS